MNQAFSALRRYARSHNQRLSVVAETLIDGTLDATALLTETPPA